ncbi:MAG: flavin-nucleotide-binding protein [Rhodospirillales bacterium 70-18]|nr:pyridoxamine 5'-phosphate oxidase family protein [Rhodospirillales bacterium]OJY73663.1 MAG: flavin-nucleotide-binding protein [Rhodospirillales bacterium 70-18]
MSDHIIRDEAALRALYGMPSGAAVAKQVDHLHPHYQSMIRAAPFAVLATIGPNGVDATPRGDAPGFVEIADDRTLLLPDRRGNNRIDSLRNIVTDPRVALLFLIPGIGETLRVNGTAEISIDPALLTRFVVDGKPPRSVLVVRVITAFFQCTKALVRSRLWDPAAQIPRTALPSTGTIVADIARGQFDAAAYDAAAPQRLKETLY